MKDQKYKETTNNENTVYEKIENTGKSKNSTSINYESELLLKQNLATIKAKK